MIIQSWPKAYMKTWKYEIILLDLMLRLKEDTPEITKALRNCNAEVGHVCNKTRS